MHAALASNGTGDTFRRFRNPQDGNWHVQLMQGDTYITDSPDEVLSTGLGSCVSACIRDPITRIGGMNHFLLPEGSGTDRDARRFGVNAMEILINGILSRGGIRGRLEAKLFGGSNVIAALSSVGTKNAAFAKAFLADEGIAVTGGSLGGTLPRRIQFWPATGRARQLEVQADPKALLDRELSMAVSAPPPPDDVELF